jgi:hypothetical protein
MFRISVCDETFACLPLTEMLEGNIIGSTLSADVYSR